MKQKKAFTLIELLVVITMIVIVITIVVGVKRNGVLEKNADTHPIRTPQVNKEEFPWGASDVEEEMIRLQRRQVEELKRANDLREREILALESSLPAEKAK